MNRLFHPLLILILSAAMIACADEPVCINDNTNLIKIKFIDSVGTAKNVIIESLTALENPSLYPQYTQDTTSSVSVSLNPDEPKTTLIFEFQDKTNTMELTYTLLPEFISAECGIYLTYSNLTIENHNFDSLVLVQPIIDEQVETNIEVIH